MPKTNRVTPFGEIISTQARGTLMGNRGCLHDAEGRVTKRSARRAWVTCLLEFKSRRRQVMSPGQYTELFFLDEATAFAAGHRPCATCQRARFDEFKSRWQLAHGTAEVSLEEIDRQLQAQRLASAGPQVLREIGVADLVDGAMVVREGHRDAAFLHWHGRLFPWTAGGYLAPVSPREGERVEVITPRDICAVFASGLTPRVHRSLKEPVAAVAPARADRGGPASKVSEGATSTPSTSRDQSRNRPSPQSTPQEGSTMYRLSQTPKSRALFSYFAAILEVTGMNRGETFPLQRFLGNFSGHLDAGRIEKASGGYRLTRSGMDYFADRFNAGSRQHVTRADVDHLARGIRNGGTGWDPI